MKLFSQTITGLILAGGQARRMGEEKDKAFLLLAGKPLIAHVLQRLQPQLASTPLISANGDPNRFKPFGLSVVPDLRQGFQGPLAGVEAAFSTTKSDWILSVPVDVPFLPNNLVEKMADKAEVFQQPVVAMSGGRLHYVVSLWPRSVFESLVFAIDNKQLSLRGWFEENPHQSVDFFANGWREDPFFNINRPIDLIRAEERQTAY